MNFVSKFFDELSSKEVYEILKSRAEIFVVEQNIVYQDMDDIDYEALHIFYEEGGRVAAYLRAYSVDSKSVKVGRVLTLRHGEGLGGRLLHSAIEEIKNKLSSERICIDAQCHAIGFYKREGFKQVSDEFLEEGIMHVKMLLEL